MYVDNTNLLHCPKSSATDDEELIAHVQTATTDYGQLAQASGGILKAKKCLGLTKLTLCGIVLFNLNTFFSHVFACP